MKKSVKMLLAVCALAFTVLLLSGTESKAATSTTMNLRQTDAGTSYIYLEWNANLLADRYEVYLSTDAKNWVKKDYSYSAKGSVFGLGAGSAYYAQVRAYTESGAWFLTSETAVVATKPAEVKGLAQTGATANSISMSWTPVSGANGYIIYASVNYNWVKIATTTRNSATISGLPASSEVKYCVAATRNVTGGTVIGTQSSGVYMRTVPAKVSRIAMTYYWDSLREAKYEWTQMNNVDGYQYEVKKSNGKKTYFSGTTTSSYAYAKPFPKGTFIKARVRAYITIGNRRVYGPWSSYTYSAANKKVTAKRSSNGKKIYLKWKKISGVSGYQVYVSTKSNSGFKKVKSLSSKKTKYTITKCGKKKLKKGKTYYVRLKYQTKVGKKKVTGSIISEATVY